MKKIALVVAIALAVIVGLTGCDTGSSSTPDKTDAKAWSIKGSYDSWNVSAFDVNEIDSTKQTFEITGLYSHPTLPIVYEFVLVNPEGKEFKIEGLDKTVTSVIPGTAFVLGASATDGSTTLANVGFVAAKSSYTVTVDVSTATAPSVNLIAGSEAATVVTNAVLLEKLEIKGNQFSKINTVAVDAWTATKGTETATTMSWDVFVDNKNGEFGFNTLDGWKQGVKPDVTALDVDVSTGSVNLLNDGGNCSLVGMPKSGSVYTITVTVDVTKSVAEGRYSLTATYKTAGTENWAFEVPASVFITGDVTGGWNEADDDALRPTLTVASGKATYNFTATETKEIAFKIALVEGSKWDGLIGFGGIATTGTTVVIKDAFGNIAFDAIKDTAYIVSIDFSGTYVTDGKPIVTITIKE